VFVIGPQKFPAIRTVGTAFFPEDDRAEFIMALQTPPGSNIEYTRLKAEEAARVAARTSRGHLHLHDARQRLDGRCRRRQRLREDGAEDDAQAERRAARGGDS
jgi:hypothetical protein